MGAGAIDTALNPGGGVVLGQAALDPGTQGIVNQQTADAMQSTQQITDKNNANINQVANSFLMSPEQAQAHSLSLGGSGATTDGLRQVYAAKASKQIDQLKLQNQYKSEMQRADMLRQAAQTQLGQQQVQTNMNQMAADIYSQNQQARAQMIGSLFQTAGTAYGMYKGNQAKSLGATNRADDAEFGQADRAAVGRAPPNPYGTY